MLQFDGTRFIAGPNDPILVTGAGGFIGRRVVAALVARGFRRVRGFVRSSASAAAFEAGRDRTEAGAAIDVIRGNLLSRSDCERACADAVVVIHLAAGTGQGFSDAFLNSVVATRNLLDACVARSRLRRFVNVSSFVVYPNGGRGRMLDESCPIESHPERRADPYCFAKVKQEQIVRQYAAAFDIPCVTVRPGSVYGPGKSGIPSRVGVDTFGVFLHLGGRNVVPLTYVDNCADAIVLAGLTRGVDGETFNVIDDQLPTSAAFLRLYKQHVRRFSSVYVPHVCSYTLCWLWERYSSWSRGQLPAAFSRARWRSQWQRTRYSNALLKNRLGWTPAVPTMVGLARYFRACADTNTHA